MKRNRKETGKREVTVRVWTYADARTALPYLTSIVRSLREHWLESCGHRRRERLLAKRPGRPDRATLIATQDAAREAEAAEGRFFDALAELQALDIYCIDPVRGQALVPFMHEKQLAWYVFDLFEPDYFRFWRFHSDPLETRRPIAEVLAWASDTGRSI
jgi:hypothetical protein